MSLGAGLVKQEAESARSIVYRVFVRTKKDTRSRTRFKPGAAGAFEGVADRAVEFTRVDQQTPNLHL